MQAGEGKKDWKKVEEENQKEAKLVKEEDKEQEVNPSFEIMLPLASDIFIFTTSERCCCMQYER